MTEPAPTGRRLNEQLLRLDFECLQSIRGGINEVRLWWDDLFGLRTGGEAD